MTYWKAHFEKTCDAGEWKALYQQRCLYAFDIFCDDHQHEDPAHRASFETFLDAFDRSLTTSERDALWTSCHSG